MPSCAQKPRRDRNPRPHGFTLVEVMVMGAVGIVIVLGITEGLFRANQGALGVQAISSRDQLLTSIGRLAGNPEALKASLAYAPSAGTPGSFPSNAGSMFQLCAQGGTPNGCTANTSYGFTLTDLTGHPIAGTSATAAAVYDVSGKLCGPEPTITPSSLCPILAYSTFTASCASGASTCDQASTITVTYTLEQPNNVNLKGLARIKPISQTVTTAVPFSGSATGIPNMLAKWLSTTDLGVSGVYEDNASPRKLGIGTTSPQETLDLNGTMHFSGMMKGGDLSVVSSLLSGYNATGIIMGFSDQLAVGIGENTQHETGLGISNSGKPEASYFYSSGAAYVKSYGGIPINFVTEDASHNGGVRMTIDGPTGNVAIGPGAPNDKLDVYGNAQINGTLKVSQDIYATNVYASSDRRLKKDITDLKEGLGEILQLRPVRYRWKNASDDSRENLGLIAQEVEAIFPEAVATNAQGYKAINYPALISPMIQAVHDLNDQVERQQRTIDELEARLQRLEKKK